mgnify:CR=1 FL=1
MSSVADRQVSAQTRQRRKRDSLRRAYDHLVRTYQLVRWNFREAGWRFRKIRYMPAPRFNVAWLLGGEPDGVVTSVLQQGAGVLTNVGPQGETLVFLPASSTTG